MGSFSFGKNKSKYSSESKMDQDVFSPQLQRKYMSNVSNQYMNQRRNANLGFQMLPQMQQQQGNVFQSGYGGMRNQLAGGAYGDTSDVREKLMASFDQGGGPSNMSRMYEDIIGGSGNTYIDPQIDAMRTGSFENMDRAMSGNALDAADMGQGGSNRHAMQNSMTQRRGLQDLNMNEANLRAGAYDKDLDWKMKIAGLADTGAREERMASQDQMMSMLGGSNQAMQGGMQYGPTAQNLGMGYMAPWMQAMQGPWGNMDNYANAMPDPTVLSSASSSSSGKGKGMNFGMAGTGS